MFERYSENARNVMRHARMEVQKLGHDHLGTEHILLGLIEVKEGVAASVLRHKEINLPHVKDLVGKMAKSVSSEADVDYASLPRTSHAQNVFDDAVKEARELKHNYIGSEHLLLGLLHENQGTGAQILQNMGMELDDVRRDVLRFLSIEEEVKN